MIGAVHSLTLAGATQPEYPSVDDFLPDPFVFANTPFAINRIILVRIIATIIMLLVLGITAKRAKLIPGRWQGAIEWLIEFVRDSIVYEARPQAPPAQRPVQDPGGPAMSMTYSERQALEFMYVHPTAPYDMGTKALYGLQNKGLIQPDIDGKWSLTPEGVAAAKAIRKGR